MDLLLDSHVALWWVAGDSSRGPEAASAIEEAEQAFVSVVTPWELGIKRAVGKLVFPAGLTDTLLRAGFTMLQVTAEHAERAPDFAPHHRDSFDRMLVAQTQVEGLRIVTADPSIGWNDADVLDARR